MSYACDDEQGYLLVSGDDLGRLRLVQDSAELMSNPEHASSEEP